MTRVGAWIGRLPDPTAIQELTIYISGDGDGGSGPSYPSAADYYGLCSVIEPLCTRGGLKQIHLKTTVGTNADLDDGPLARSSAAIAVARAFAPILEEIILGGYQRIICNSGKVDVLLIKNAVEILHRKGFV